MKVLIAAVGRLKPGPIHDIIQDYLKRITWPLTIKEIENKDPLPTTARQNQESQNLLKVIPGTSTIIALDEHGKNISSQGLANLIHDYQQRGIQTIAFVIGGADGHHSNLLEKAHHKISFGAATWPHMLVRAMLIEQLYRAQQILAGHPYHK